MPCHVLSGCIDPHLACKTLNASTHGSVWQEIIAFLPTASYQTSSNNNDNYMQSCGMSVILVRWSLLLCLLKVTHFQWNHCAKDTQTQFAQTISPPFCSKRHINCEPTIHSKNSHYTHTHTYVNTHEHANDSIKLHTNAHQQQQQLASIL